MLTCQYIAALFCSSMSAKQSEHRTGTVAGTSGEVVNISEDTLLSWRLLENSVMISTLYLVKG